MYWTLQREKVIDSVICTYALISNICSALASLWFNLMQLECMHEMSVNNWIAVGARVCVRACVCVCVGGGGNWGPSSPLCVQ